jgi:uncharacterized repeat protein (TIGR03803 family)
MLFETGAHATTYKVLTTVANGPIIGAMKGPTLYGVTPNGGTGNGTLFTVTNTGVYKLLHNFNGSFPHSDGSQPTLGLDVDTSGNIYGTASNGGMGGGGTLWKYVPTTGVMTALHTFNSSGDGANPLQGPLRMGSGVFYGTTSDQAISSDGNVWRYNADGTYTELHNFLSTQTDGHCPFSGLVRATDGTLYGTVIGWGYGGLPNGAVWQLSTANVLKILYVFQDGNDGEWPDQTPTLDKNGNIYGTTHSQNGIEFPGAIWTISASGTFSVVHDLNSATEGAQPNGPLMLNVDGNLYGTTATGGAHGQGTVFQVTPAGGFKVVYSFAGGSLGGKPTGGLVHDGVGNLYGGTSTGQVFKLVP